MRACTAKANKDWTFAYSEENLGLTPKGSNDCSPSHQMVGGSTCSQSNSNFMSQSTALNVSHFLQMPTEFMWGPIPRGGRPENNGGQFTNESVTNRLPNLWPLGAAQRRHWHSSWLFSCLTPMRHPRHIPSEEWIETLQLLTNCGLFTTESVTHE